MADFGESLPFEGRAPELHNAFPQLWAEANRRVIEGDAFSAEQAVFFTRSAGALSPRYTTLQWMGDQLTSWDARDGLHSALIAQLAAGLSGLSHAHSDVGGYTMIKADPLVFLRDAQLLLRWAEMSAFADSVLRTHEGLWPADSAQAYDDDVLPGLARMAKCHALLWPLRDALQRKSPGLPLVRHAWMHMPEDPQALRIKTQFFLASDEVIVCPVLHPNRTSASCYLPARSDFEHAFRPEVRFEQRDTARWVDCPAPLGSPCVLFAANSTSFRPLAEAMRRL
jgi:alpha-glucosidase